MAKYIVGVIALILIIAAGYYFFFGAKPPATSVAAPGTPAAVQQIATSTYATTTFSVVYPADFTIDPNFQNTEVSVKKPISGVKFTIPLTMATGTNLGSDTFVSVEQLPRAKNCTGDIYIADTVHPESVVENGVSYSVATTSGAGAGNFYEESVYAIEGSSPCTAVRYWIHSSTIGNYDPGAVREFDRAALMAAFDSIRRSLTLTR